MTAAELIDKRGPHTVRYATTLPDTRKRGAPVGWVAGCDCGWEACGNRGGLAAAVAAGRQHERDADERLERVAAEQGADA
jgi:hypothetical protein